MYTLYSIMMLFTGSDISPMNITQVHTFTLYNFKLDYNSNYIYNNRINFNWFFIWVNISTNLKIE